jgi:hypothetical protein
VTWKERQCLGLCCYPGCATPPLADYCERHERDKNERNRQHMQRARLFMRVQLRLAI